MTPHAEIAEALALHRTSLGEQLRKARENACDPWPQHVETVALFMRRIAVVDGLMGATREAE